MDQISAACAALPFEAPASPAQAFEHSSWRQARQTALEALAAGWLALVIGERGAGKTLLLRELERLLRAGGVRVHLSGPDGAAEPVGPGIVRLVDGADALDNAALHRLALEGGATVLAILPSSAHRLRDLPARVAPAWLSPLSPAEVEAFVAATLARAGSPPDLFGAEAVAALASCSGGLPSLLNALGRASLLQARMEGAPRVEARHVEAATKTLCLGAGPAEAGTAAGHASPALPLPAEDRPRPVVVAAASRPSPQRRALAALLVLPALLLTLAGWFLPESPLRSPAEEQTMAAASGESAVAAAAVEGPAAAADDAAAATILSQPAPDAAGGRMLASPAAAAVPSRPGDEVPRPDAAGAPPEPGTFRGTTFNETLGRSGGLRISVSRTGPGDLVMVRFEASGGLVGVGRLAGRLSSDGRLVASGTLMMGQNPFATELEGRISGDLLVGTARYTRVVEPGMRPISTRGSFRLKRG